MLFNLNNPCRMCAKNRAMVVEGMQVLSRARAAPLVSRALQPH